MRSLPKARFALAVVLIGAGAVAVISVVHLIRRETTVTPDRPVHAATLAQRFAILSRHHSNKCGLRPESLDSISAGGRLQGSCCSPMNLQHYEEHPPRDFPNYEPGSWGPAACDPWMKRDHRRWREL